MIFKLLLLATVTIWWAVWVMPSNRVKLIVCDVGQGDALLVTKGTFQMLIDGGPDAAVLHCLDKYLPFYDRQIELVMATHPDADHITGLVEVFNRYRVQKLVRLPVTKDSAVFRKLIQSAQATPRIELYTGDRLKLGATGLVFETVWPTRSYFAQHKDQPDQSNLVGIVGILSFGQTDVLLAADADSQVDGEELATGLLRGAEILKVPHHGSKTSMTADWLRVVSPQLALISVGRKNHYGHPGEETLKLLRERAIKLLRTDEVGDIVLDLQR